jgi:two-component system, OmpR family, response regulator MtrA
LADGFAASAYDMGAGGTATMTITGDAGALSISAFPRILAVDADPDMRTVLEHGLGNHGFEVKVVSDGRNAVAAVKDFGPEAILLEGRLPGIDAASLISTFRRITDVPILMICGGCPTTERLLALSLGADDNIAKPFDLEEVAAYIRARLRRPRMEIRDVVNYADVAIDVTQRKVARAGKTLDLSTREFDLLLTLARRPEQVFTREHLLDLVWGVDREVTLATVETYISYLRSKINITGSQPLIQTVRGVGYTMRMSPPTKVQVTSDRQEYSTPQSPVAKEHAVYHRSELSAR